MNVENLKPGRELDALVAEKVMSAPTPHEAGISQKEYESRRNAWHPAYSTDIAAAWEVVEKLEDLGLVLQLWRSEKNDREGWYAHLTAKYWISSGYEGEKGETAPHAICIAALRAVGA